MFALATLQGKLVAALALLAIGFSAGGLGTYKYMRAAEARDMLAKVQASRETERLVARDNTRIQDATNAQIRAINARHAVAIAGLRNRAGRMPEAARTTCAGATGAELSGPDGSFLAGEAARARELQVQLGSCQDREWATYRRLNGIR